MNPSKSSLPLPQMIDAYLDDELAPDDRWRFEQRLARDPELRAQVARERQFRQRFRDHVRQTAAPGSLRAEVMGMLASARTSAVETTPSPSPSQRLRTWWRAAVVAPRWAALAAAMLLFILGAGFSAFLVSAPAPTKTTHTAFRRLAGKHVVYFGSEPALDVQGDAQRITAWLQSRAPWPVVVPQFVGWELVGGRLGEFHHEPAIFLLYQQGDRRLSLVQFSPRDDDFPPDARQALGGMDVYVDRAMGHPVVLWRQGDVGYGVIGDASQSTAQLLPLVQQAIQQISEK